jgi:hypothetical protein
MSRDISRTRTLSPSFSLAKLAPSWLIRAFSGVAQAQSPPPSPTGFPMIGVAINERRTHMFTARSFPRSFLFAAASFLSMAIFAPGILSASDFVIEGSYATHGTIGPNLGSSIGVYNVEKDGSFTGYALLNLPSADGKSRNLIRVDVSGTITTNADGTGQVKYNATVLPTGTLPPFTEDFVITKAADEGYRRLALEIFDQREVPSFLLGTGNEVSIVWNRLPDN